MEELARVALQSLVGQYPILVSILVIMGVCRAIFKPLFTFLQKLVDATPGESDNELLKKVMDHKIYKVLSFILDFGASIKLPQKK